MASDRILHHVRTRQLMTEPLAAAMRSMFAEQDAAVRDRSKRLAWCCARRAGKTNGMALWLYEGGLSDPGGFSLYVGRTQYLARTTILPAFEEMRANYGLRFQERSRDNQLQILLPNGHAVWLAGCKNSAEFGKFRGPKFRRAAWDEAQLSGEWLREAIEDAIDPALSDKDGELLLGGTPGFAPVGYWYDAAMGRGAFTAHRWTCLQNPYWRKRGDGEQYLAAKREANGWDESHPTYMREWRGLWVHDSSVLVFDWDRERNAGTPDPFVKASTVIGVDLGDTSSTAWVVVQTLPGSPEVYVVEVMSRESLTPSAVCAHTEALLRRYQGARVVVDAGGLGGAYVREMRERHGIPAEPADKRDRRAAIEMLRGDVASGSLKVDPQRCRALIDEWEVLQWNEKRDNFDDRFADHMTDACLYAHRHARPMYRPEVEPDMSPDAQAVRYKQRVAAQIRKQQREKARRQGLRLH